MGIIGVDHTGTESILVVDWGTARNAGRWTARGRRWAVQRRLMERSCAAPAA
jgi:hypothetical protein